MAAILVHVATTEGHDGFPPTKSKGGNTLVTVEGKPVILVGQEFEPHSKDGSTHTPKLVGGSSFVSINGIAVGMVGDKLDCGDTVIATASSLVTIGG